MCRCKKHNFKCPGQLAYGSLCSYCYYSCNQSTKEQPNLDLDSILSGHIRVI